MISDVRDHASIHVKHVELASSIDVAMAATRSRVRRRGGLHRAHARGDERLKLIRARDVLRVGLVVRAAVGEHERHVLQEVLQRAVVPRRDAAADERQVCSG